MEMAGPVPDIQSGYQDMDLQRDPYLPEFERLGGQICLYSPPVLDMNALPAANNADSDSTESTHPHLYIVCSWMGARSRNIKKYTTAIQTRYPASKILLLRQDGNDLFWRPVSVQLRNLAPAVETVRSLVEKRKPDRLRVLVHIFSNGGSYTACQFADAYRNTTGKLLPVSALVLDSTPSFPNIVRTHQAFSEYLPKPPPVYALLSAALWAYIGLGNLVGKLAGSEDITMSLRRRLNDPNGAFTQGKVKRVYIYSQADKLIPAADVEAHAKEAMAVIGPDRVKLEDFVTSRHVAHVVLDEKRYWTIVENLWQETVSSLRDE
ncbi:hypothetical protein ABEF95_008692 [Exophiala dermatitidis]